MRVQAPGIIRTMLSADANGYINNSTGTPATNKYVTHDILNASYFVSNYSGERGEIAEFISSILAVGGITGSFNRATINFS